VYRIDRDKCTACGDCLETCYYDALTRYGEEKTSEEVFKAVERDKMFYRRSGGGVTVSGGEPLLHPAFVWELFEQCHRAEINTAVETCGFVPKEAFEEVLPVTDLFLFDLKQMDSERHEYWTGGKNERILENARMVVEAGAKVLFRQPIIPGVNDNLGNICATADFMKSLGSGGMDIQLMPYHRMGQSKYAALNQPYGMGDVSVFTAEQVEEFCRAYIAAGVNCTISK
jgi:pyruvate formate lyase activating enzyme